MERMRSGELKMSGSVRHIGIKSGFALAAVSMALLTGAPSARADLIVQFELEDVTIEAGCCGYGPGSATGTFTVNESSDTVTSFDITYTSGGLYPSVTFDSSLPGAANSGFTDPNDLYFFSNDVIPLEVEGSTDEYAALYFQFLHPIGTIYDLLSTGIGHSAIGVVPYEGNDYNFAGAVDVTDDFNGNGAEVVPVSTTPEPGMFGPLGCYLALLGAAVRKRRRNATQRPTLLRVAAR